MEKILILVPHGDDEVLGFGGAISKHVRKGDIVDVGFLKSRYNDRTTEQEHDIERAAKILGYNNFHKLDIISRDGLNFSAHNLHKVEEFVEKITPDILYIPHIGDVHQDHHTTIDFARIATRIHSRGKVSKVLSGEIISSSGNAFFLNKFFTPQYYIRIEEEDLIKKQKALECYSREIRPYPHPRSSEGIKIYAQMRGMECGVMYAEAFECLRYIEL